MFCNCENFALTSVVNGILSKSYRVCCISGTLASVGTQSRKVSFRIIANGSVDHCNDGNAEVSSQRIDVEHSEETHHCQDPSCFDVTAWSWLLKINSHTLALEKKRVKILIKICVSKQEPKKQKPWKRFKCFKISGCPI